MERGYTLYELWAAARRRAKPALAVTAIVLVVSVVVIALLPNEYRARATIILEPHRPHPELVTLSTTALLEDRLRVARQQLLATPLLERVVLENDLYPDLRAEDGLEAAVAELRAHLEVHPDGDSAVVVAFRTREKEKAAPVVLGLARGFVEANAELRTAQSQRVLDILIEELDAVAGKLQEHEERVREFRRAHDGELPEQVESNLREAERNTRLLDSTAAWMRDLERRRALAVLAPASPEVARLSELQAELQRQLNHARSIFNEEHPEPVRLARELEGIRQLRGEAESRQEAGRRERDLLARELTRAHEEIATLRENIARARARAEAGAQRGAELAVLERDRDLLRERYRSLLARRVEGEVALSLERRSAPLSTRIVDPPSAPQGASAPDRWRYLLLALAAALGLGLATGVTLESRDGSVRTPAQVRQALEVPLIGVLPRLAPPRLTRRRARRPEKGKGADTLQ